MLLGKEVWEILEMSPCQMSQGIIELQPHECLPVLQVSP